MQELLDLSVELSQDNKQVGAASTMVTFDRIPGVDPHLQLSTDWQCHTTHVNGVQCHRLLEKNPYSEVLLPE